MHKKTKHAPLPIYPVLILTTIIEIIIVTIIVIIIVTIIVIIIVIIIGTIIIIIIGIMTLVIFTVMHNKTNHTPQSSFDFHHQHCHNHH